jgi:hypothetical protein
MPENGDGRPALASRDEPVSTVFGRPRPVAAAGDVTACPTISRQPAMRTRGGAIMPVRAILKRR